MSVPPHAAELAGKLEELEEEDVEEVSTAFGDLQLGGVPQMKRRSSAPTITHAMWGSSHPSSAEQMLLSPKAPTNLSLFTMLSEEFELPEEGLRPQEAWSEHHVGSHPHQEKEEDYMVQSYSIYCSNLSVHSDRQWSQAWLKVLFFFVLLAVL